MSCFTCNYIGNCLYMYGYISSNDKIYDKCNLFKDKNKLINSCVFRRLLIIK
jgi:hypothetical protein